MMLKHTKWISMRGKSANKTFAIKTSGQLPSPFTKAKHTRITWISSFTHPCEFFFRVRHELRGLAALPLTDWALRLALVSQSTLPTAHPPPCPSGEVEALEAEIATHASLQTHRLVCPSSLTPSSLSFKQRGTDIRQSVNPLRGYRTDPHRCSSYTAYHFIWGVYIYIYIFFF